MVLVALGGLVGYWQWILLGGLAEQVVYDARENMIRHFLRARLFPLLGRSSGELVTRVTSDTVLLREAASSSLVNLLNAGVVLIGSLVLMAVLDLVLLGVTLVAVLGVVALYATLLPAIGTAQQRSQAALGTLGAALDSTMRAVKTVKAACAEDRQVDRLLAHAEDARRHSLLSVRREAMVLISASTGLQSAIIGILAFGAWRVSLGEIEVSTLVAFLLYAFGLTSPISELSTNLSTLQAGIAAAGRIQEVESLALEDGDDRRGAAAPARSGPVIELRGVTARYPGAAEPAVRDVDLVVPDRGHLAVVGPSGAGKTTLMSLMLRFLEPERGEVLLDGAPYGALDVHAIRRHFAYVEQETPVVPGTVRDNLLFAAPDATDERLREVLDSIHLGDTVAAMEAGLDTPLSETSVSGGQRQRIALARALLARPRVLLLDEATAQVDGLTESAVHAVIREQAARGTVVTIAHRLSTVLDADEIVVVQASRIVARGTHEELLVTSPLYASLVESLRIPTAPAPV
jgi:ATP-binding cassette subfamily B protein